MTRLLPAVLAAAVFAGFVFAGLLAAQSAPKAAAPAADLNQLMRGLFFPNANVVFSTQIHDPAEIKMTIEPSASTDPLTSVFGNWEAVQNSALVLSDAADLPDDARPQVQQRAGCSPCEGGLGGFRQ